MPFSFFAARCLYVARQPLKYRQDVIKRTFATRIVSHTALITGIKGPEIVEILFKKKQNFYKNN